MIQKKEIEHLMSLSQLNDDVFIFVRFMFFLLRHARHFSGPLVLLVCNSAQAHLFGGEAPLDST